MSNLQADITASIAVQKAGSSVDLAQAAFLASDQGRDEVTEQYLSIATGVTAQVLSLGAITTVSELLLISSVTVSIKINGSLTALAGKVFLLSGAAITSLTISNASGSTAQVQLVLAGS